MKTLKINFSDFWRGFDKTDNYFWHLLSKRYKLELSEQPDFLLYSAYGKAHRKYTCCRIFYTSENVRPNLWECDYAFSFDYNNAAKHYRLPLYVLYDDITKLVQPKNADEILKSKTKFCNFLFSNEGAKERIIFFNKLSKYKKVDSGGKVLNNLGYEVKDKLSFINDYKFTIAFENSSYPGYTTEKIFHSMLMNSIPVYWGNPWVSLDFNTKSFVNVHDYKSFDDAIERIVEIDKSDALYTQYIQEPYFTENVLPHSLTEEAILARFEQIVNSTFYRNDWLRSVKRKISFIKKDVKTYSKVVKRKYLGGV